MSNANTSKSATPAIEAEELPKAIVRRVVKDKLSELSNADGDGGDPNNVAIHKDALLAFSESARIFIHYLSATANDICKESKRQTINAEDVFNALEEIEFIEFIEPLKAALNDFRKRNARKKAGAMKVKVDKKRKAEGTLKENENGENGVEEVDVEEVNEDAPSSED
ncbi:hypothetical protein Syun_028321 [Stephania yunnanensis]|uniref:Transcription factor CBF/NF-Y/archaeal histone domain-containing protein n=1 Tax=Stephania yunnanensis TaxID=152371 RepID=A0AAP0EJN8_9MAGN